MDKSKAVKILETGVRQYSPVVAEFFDSEEKIIDYAKSLYDYTVDDEYKARQKKIIRAINFLSKKLFQKELSLPSPLALNVVDHHTILNHPIFLATNTVANAFKIFNKEASAVALTSAIVPQDNFFNKKGFQLNGKRIPIFKDSEKRQSSCFIPKHNFNFLHNFKKSESWKLLNQREQDFLQDIQSKILSLDFGGADDYDEQITILNKYLWKQIFSSDVRDSACDLYYLAEEDIMAYLVDDVLDDSNFIGQAIFNDEFRKKVLDAFRGHAGCWNEQLNKGTHFFWYKNSRNEAERMYLQNGILITQSGVRIELNKQKLIELVKTKQIVVDVFLIVGYLVFWCGIRPLVGHGSSTYITKMKTSWLEVLKENHQTEQKRVASVDTKGLVGGEIVTFKRIDGEVVIQFAFDLIASGGLNKEYIERILHMKYKDLLKPALLDIYDSYVPLSEKVDLGLKPSDMMGKEFDWIK